MLAALIAGIAMTLQVIEVELLGQPIIEGLVLAIVLGVVIRTVWGLRQAYAAGVGVAAKQVLEVAIVLLGASVDLPALLKAGPAMLVAIALVVVIGIAASKMIGRALGLNPRLATLVACGNAICGNSAIAAVAPVIGADNEDVVASIALTAVLGVLLVLLLPYAIPLVGLTLYQYGVLAGMTVYAVPQVLAATLPVSPLSGDVGTLVKLVRVLLLGPVVLFFALRHRQPTQARSFSLTRYVPWFVVGFLILGVARSTGLLPPELADPLRAVSRWLTVIAMAALGLGVDLRSLRTVGRPVALAVIGSLIVLILLSLFAIKVLNITG